MISPRDRAESIGRTEAATQALTGRIRVLSEPSGATIEVNDVRQSTTTDALITSAVGEKHVKIFFPRASLNIMFVLEANEEVIVRANFLDGTISVDKKVTINFHSRPAGANLSIDGQMIGALPRALSLDIRQRPYRVSINLPGHETYTMNLSPRENDLIEAILEPLERTLIVSSTMENVAVYSIRGNERDRIATVETSPSRLRISGPGTWTFVAEKQKDGVIFLSEPKTVTFGIDDVQRQIRVEPKPVNATTLRVMQDPVFMPESVLMIPGRPLGPLNTIDTVLLPAGLQTISIDTTTFTYEFSEGSEYLLEPLFRLPTEGLDPLADASTHGGYRRLPTKPELLPEQRPTYITERDWGPWLGYSFLWGGTPGLLVGYRVDQDTPGVWVLCSAIGTALMMVFALRDWEREVANVRAHNDRLVAQENTRRQTERDRLDELNRKRGVIILSGPDGETTIPILPPR